jgi:hypothetical protein
MFSSFLSAVITRLILLLLWVPTLIHAVCGSKYTAVIQMTVAFIALQLVGLAMNIFGHQIGAPAYEFSYVNALAYGVFDGAMYAIFNAVNLELAWIYRNIAKTTPLAIHGLELDQE